VRACGVPATTSLDARRSAAGWRLPSRRSSAVATALGSANRIALETPHGPLVLPIIGEVADMSSNSGTVILSGSVREWWRDPTSAA